MKGADVSTKTEAMRILIHGIKASGIDSLTGKEGEVLIVTFDDGTIHEGELSQRSLMQLVRMKLSGNGKASRVPEAEATDGAA